MNFEKDIFISYAHIDDESLVEGAKGWISEFHRALEVRLAQLLGEKPVIWRDSQLQGNDFFSPEIVKQFQRLKVMVSIITPRYVKSEWCTKEVDEFFKAAAITGGISIENKARIFKVIKTPVEFEELPEKIKSILSYEFYRKDSETGRNREFNKIFGQESEQAFWAKLDDVAYDIAQLIEKLNSLVIDPGSGKTHELKTASYNSGLSNNANLNAERKIYLANTTRDLKDFYENIKRELKDSGYTVLPDNNLTPELEDFTTEVEAYMNDCSLSIHLIGSSFGLKLDGTEKSVIMLQNEIAAKKSIEKGLNRLIWIAPGNETQDANQLNFIDQLRHNETLHQGSDLLEGTIEEFKFAIFDNIRKQEEKERAKIEAIEKEKLKQETKSATLIKDDKDPRLVYLICDQRDLESTKPLEDFIFDSGHEVMLPIFEGEESQLRKEHEENLKLCDAVILYYGNANELWLRSMTRDLLRLPALERTKPLLSGMAYLADPSNPQKDRFRSHELIVANGQAGFKPALLTEFINNLK